MNGRPHSPLVQAGRPGQARLLGAGWGCLATPGGSAGGAKPLRGNKRRATAPTHVPCEAGDTRCPQRTLLQRSRERGTWPAVLALT